MKDLRYKVKNIYFDNLLGIQRMLVDDLKDEEEFHVSFDEDLNLILGKHIDKQDMYLAYIDYIEMNQMNYYYKQHQLDVVPKKYVQMYYHFDEYYKEHYQEEVDDKIGAALKYLEEVKEYLNINYEENAASYYTKMSQINSAEFELNKVRKLTK